MLIDRLSEKKNISALKAKIENRIINKALIFGNKIEIAEKKILEGINEILYNEDYFKKCEFCEDFYNVLELKEVENYILCEDCIESNYSYCNDCGDYINKDNINILEENIYCNKCYFEIKQEAYNNHILKDNRLLELKENKIDIFKLQFIIDNNIWEIESYARKNFRLGSFGANSWIDIGDNKKVLLEAIEYNLGKNINKLDRIDYKY